MNDQSPLTLLDYLEGKLNANEEVEFAQSLADPEVRQEYNEYRAIMAFEQLIAGVEPRLEVDLSAALISQIEQERSDDAMAEIQDQKPGEKPETMFSTRRVRTPAELLFRSLLATNIALLGVLVVLLVRGMPQAVPSAGITVPQGYVLVSLETAVKPQLLRAGERVDLQVAYSEDSEGYSRRDIARHLPLIEVQPVFDSAIAQSRLYLLVPDERAKLLDYARLFGEVEVLPISSQKSNARAQVLRDPEGRMIDAQVPTTSAVMYLPRKAQYPAERLIYRNGAWIEEPEVRIAAF